MPGTNSQVSDQGIQIDYFPSEPSATVSDAKSLSDINLVLKSTLPIPSPKEEKPKFIPICNRGEFFVELKKIKQSLTLEEVSPTTEISEKIEPSLEEYK